MRRRGVCRRCGKPIVWMRAVDGTAIALDPMPHPDGTVVTTDRGPAGVRAMMVSAANVEADPGAARRDRYRRHALTCENPASPDEREGSSSDDQDGAA